MYTYGAKPQQRRHFPWWLLITFLLLAALGGTAWFAYDQYLRPSNTSKAPQQTNVTPKTVTSQDPTTQWKQISTTGQAFSMRVPNGWKMTIYPGDYLGSTSTTYQASARPTIERSATPYEGDSLRFRASIQPIADMGLGPQWSSPQPGLTETNEDFAIGKLEGRRYEGVFTKTVNQTVYQYVFDLSGGKKLDIVYTVDHTKNEKDDVATVEKAIRTIALKK